VLHRDVKPANVLVRKGPGGWQVKLIDFGLAVGGQALRATARAGGTGPRSVLWDSLAGTLRYAAPEQLGQLPGVAVGPAADLYGLARTGCYALFGTPTPLLKHWRGIPQGLADLLGQCLEEDPRARPAGCAEVLSRLEALGTLPGPEAESAVGEPPPAVPGAPGHTPAPERVPGRLAPGPGEARGADGLVCAHCQTAVPAGDLVCPQCGQPLPARAGPKLSARRRPTARIDHPPEGSAVGSPTVEIDWPPPEGEGLGRRVRRVRLLDRLRQLQGALTAAEKSRRQLGVTVLGLLLGGVLALLVGAAVGQSVDNSRRLAREYESLHPRPRFPSEFDPEYRDAEGRTDFRRLWADQRLHNDYPQAQHLYVMRHRNEGTVVFLTVLSGGLTLAVPPLLLRWRRRLQRNAATASCKEQARRLSESYPDAVREWGGEQVLENAALVAELVRALEKEPAGSLA
jgi:hypothetical protein